MPNIVVTVPKHFWPEWIEEGDAAGEVKTGTEWGFYMGGRPPPVEPGDRLYIVAHGMLRGYSPITRLRTFDCDFCICREGGGVAVTIDQTIKGFQGWRYVWWEPKDERPFPDRMTAGVHKKLHPTLGPGRRRSS